MIPNYFGVREKFVYLHPRSKQVQRGALNKPSDVKHVLAKVIGCKYTAFLASLLLSKQSFKII